MDPITATALAMGPALLGFVGQRETNATNVDMQNSTNAMNVAEAQRNRDYQTQQANAQMAFQERMANTAVQRQVADMKAAGINPIMAATGGATAPAGASGSGSQASLTAARVENPYKELSSMSTKAMDMIQIAGNIKKQAAETDYIKTQEQVAKKDIPKSEITNEAYEWARKKLQQLLDYNAKRKDNTPPAVRSYDPKTQKFKIDLPNY